MGQVRIFREANRDEEDVKELGQKLTIDLMHRSKSVRGDEMAQLYCVHRCA